MNNSCLNCVLLLFNKFKFTVTKDALYDNPEIIDKLLDKIKEKLSDEEKKLFKLYVDFLYKNINK